jgi:general stress protein 26
MSVEKLRSLVAEIEVAMMTTRRADGHLVSRPMAVQKDAPGADFWFVSARDAPKIDEIRSDPHVNLGFYKDRTREYVSVSGIARLSDDRATIRKLWEPDWRAWFEDQGGTYDGSADDPRLLLIGVTAESAHFLSIDKPQVVVLFELAKGIVTGKAPDLGKVEQVAGAEIEQSSKKT